MSASAAHESVISSVRGLSALKIEHQSGIQGCTSQPSSAHRSVCLSSFVKLERKAETNIALLVFCICKTLLGLFRVISKPPWELVIDSVFGLI